MFVSTSFVDSGFRFTEGSTQGSSVSLRARSSVVLSDVSVIRDVIDLSWRFSSDQDRVNGTM